LFFLVILLFIFATSSVNKDGYIGLNIINSRTCSQTWWRNG